ncbi:Zinc finger protein 106 [Frankliniella fusca]|uniref:Zinc finger protein 106 n=1 Tax=Frankliniella fusca TaxID=407009 RepID=A0AAE1HWS8_9NEOP|nr:Zinc finger protein 106 [Frankliniella fusca]
MTITLYQHPLSPRLAQVLLTIRALGIDDLVIQKEVDLSSGTSIHDLPSIDDDGFCLSDSHAIVSYLASAYGAGGALYPADPKKRAKVDQWLHFSSSTLYNSLVDMTEPLLSRRSKVVSEERSERAEGAFRMLQAALGSGPVALRGGHDPRRPVLRLACGCHRNSMDPQWWQHNSQWGPRRGQHNSQWGPWRGHQHHNSANGYFSEDAEFRRAYHSDRFSYRNDHSNSGRKETRWDVGPQSSNEPQRKKGAKQDALIDNVTSACNINQGDQFDQRRPIDASNERVRPLFSIVVGRGRGNRFNQSRDKSHQERGHHPGQLPAPPHNGFLGRPPHQERRHHHGLLPTPPQNGLLGRPPHNGLHGKPPHNSLLGRPPVGGRKSPYSWEEDEGNEISHWLQASKSNLPSVERDPNPCKDPLPGSEEERNNTLKKATELLKQTLKKKVSVNFNELLSGDKGDKSNHIDSHPVSKVLGQPKNLAAELDLNSSDMRLIGRAQPSKTSIVQEENSNDSDDIIEVMRSPSPVRDVIDLDVSPVKSSVPRSDLEESSNSSYSSSTPNSPQNREPECSLSDALSDNQVNIRTEKPSSPSDEDRCGNSTASIIEETSCAGGTLCTASSPQCSSSTSSTVLDANCETDKSEKISTQATQSPNKRIKQSHTTPNSPKKGSELVDASSVVPKSPKHSLKSPPSNLNQRRIRSSSLCVSPSQVTRPSPFVTPNVSRQNRIISDLKKISLTKLRDLINNPRESAEKMIPAQNLTPKPDIVADERSVLADLSIDWNSLPTELIDTLGDLFNIEGVSTLLPSEVQDSEAVLLESKELEYESYLPAEAQDSEVACLEKNELELTDPEVASLESSDLNSSIQIKDNPIKIETKCEGPTPTVIPSSNVKLNEQTPVRIRVAQFARGNFVDSEIEERPGLSNQVESAELSDQIISTDSIEDNGLNTSTVNLAVQETSDITCNTTPASESVDSIADGNGGTLNKELPQLENVETRTKKRNKSKNLVRLEERTWFENASHSSSPAVSHSRSSAVSHSSSPAVSHSSSPAVNSTAETSDPICSSSLSSQGSINNMNEISGNENMTPSNGIEVLSQNDVPAILLNEVPSNENDLTNNEIEEPRNVNNLSNIQDQISTNNQTALIMPIMCVTVPANINRTIVDKMTAKEIENRIKEIDGLLQSLVQEKCLLHDTLNNLKSGVEQSENNQQNPLQHSEETVELAELPPDSRKKPKKNKGVVKSPTKNRKNLEVNKQVVELPPTKKNNARCTNTGESDKIVQQPARKRKLTCALEGQNSKKSKKEKQQSKDSNDRNTCVSMQNVKKPSSNEPPSASQKEKQQKEKQQSKDSNDRNTCVSMQNVKKPSSNEPPSASQKIVDSLPSTTSTVTSEKGTKSPETSDKNKEKESVPEQNDISSERNIAAAIATRVSIPVHQQKMEGFIVSIKTLKTSYLAASQNGLVYHLLWQDNKLFASYGEKSVYGVNCIEVMEGKEYDLLFTGGEDGLLRVFRIMATCETQFNIKPIRQVNARTPISCLAYNWNSIFVGTKTGLIMVYHVEEGKLKNTISLGGNGVLSLLTVKEGPRKVIIVGSRNQPVSVRDAESGLLLREMGTSKWTVYSLSFYNNMLFCGADQDSIAVFDFQSGRQKYKLSTGKGIIDIVQSEDVIFCACYDGNIYVFDLQGQKGITTVKGPGKMILCIAVFNRKLYCSSKMSSTLMVSDLNANIQSVMKTNSQNKALEVISKSMTGVERRGSESLQTGAGDALDCALVRDRTGVERRGSESLQTGAGDALDCALVRDRTGVERRGSESLQTGAGDALDCALVRDRTGVERRGSESLQTGAGDALDCALVRDRTGVERRGSESLQTGAGDALDCALVRDRTGVERRGSESLQTGAGDALDCALVRDRTGVERRGSESLQTGAGDALDCALVRDRTGVERRGSESLQTGAGDALDCALVRDRTGVERRGSESLQTGAGDALDCALVRDRTGVERRGSESLQTGAGDALDCALVRDRTGVERRGSESLQTGAGDALDCALVRDRTGVERRGSESLQTGAGDALDCALVRDRTGVERRGSESLQTGAGDALDCALVRDRTGVERRGSESLQTGAGDALDCALVRDRTGVERRGSESLQTGAGDALDCALVRDRTGVERRGSESLQTGAGDALDCALVRDRTGVERRGSESLQTGAGDALDCALVRDRTGVERRGSESLQTGAGDALDCALVRDRTGVERRGSESLQIGAASASRGSVLYGEGRGGEEKTSHHCDAAAERFRRSFKRGSPIPATCPMSATRTELYGRYRRAFLERSPESLGRAGQSSDSGERSRGAVLCLPYSSVLVALMGQVLEPLFLSPTRRFRTPFRSALSLAHHGRAP